MKNVVIVAPQFPPSNLTAGHRTRYFAMHLAKFGWKAKVLTVEPRYYEERLDPELEKLVPQDLEIIRTPAIPTRPIRFVGDIGVRAFWWHYRKLCRLAEAKEMDLLYIPIPPNYSAMLGPLVHKKYKIPYAIDFIDPWVHRWPGCEIFMSKAWLSYHLGRILEPVALKGACLVTAVAPGYYEGALERYSWLDPADCLALPYGAEESDFRYVDKHPRAPYLFEPGDGFFHIVYAGAMLPKAYSTLEALFKGVNFLKERHPEIFHRIRFHFIGTGKHPDDAAGFNVMPVAKRHDLSGVVSEHPVRIPYLDVINHLKHADAVLILGSSETHYTPSKIFQAILTERPVLALLHSRSTAVDTLKNANAGIAVTFDEERPADQRMDEIAAMIRQAVTAGRVDRQIDRQAFGAYTAEVMAAKLASAFELVLKRCL